MRQPGRLRRAYVIAIAFTTTMVFAGSSSASTPASICHDLFGGRSIEASAATMTLDLSPQQEFAVQEKARDIATKVIEKIQSRRLPPALVADELLSPSSNRITQLSRAFRETDRPDLDTSAVVSQKLSTHVQSALRNMEKISELAKKTKKGAWSKFLSFSNPSLRIAELSQKTMNHFDVIEALSKEVKEENSKIAEFYPKASEHLARLTEELELLNHIYQELSTASENPAFSGRTASVIAEDILPALSQTIGELTSLQIVISGTMDGLDSRSKANVLALEGAKSLSRTALTALVSQAGEETAQNLRHNEAQVPSMRVDPEAPRFAREHLKVGFLDKNPVVRIAIHRPLDESVGMMFDELIIVTEVTDASGRIKEETHTVPASSFSRWYDGDRLEGKPFKFDGSKGFWGFDEKVRVVGVVGRAQLSEERIRFESLHGAIVPHHTTKLTPGTAIAIRPIPAPQASKWARFVNGYFVGYSQSGNEMHVIDEQRRLVQVNVHGIHELKVLSEEGKDDLRMAKVPHGESNAARYARKVFSHNAIEHGGPVVGKSLWGANLTPEKLAEKVHIVDSNGRGVPTYRLGTSIIVKAIPGLERLGPVIINHVDQHQPRTEGTFASTIRIEPRFRGSSFIELDNGKYSISLDEMLGFTTLMQATNRQ